MNNVALQLVRGNDGFDLIVAAPGSQTDLLMAAVYLRPGAVELLPGPVAHRVLNDPDATAYSRREAQHAIDLADKLDGALKKAAPST